MNLDFADYTITIAIVPVDLRASICQNIFPGLINTYGEINGVSSRPT